MLDHPEYDRWLVAAGDAREAAEGAAGAGQYGWACFLAEQSAQLAVKGFLHGVGVAGWGHDLADLVERLADATGEPMPAPAVAASLRLSRHYIPTRYPDAHPSGAPAAHYGRSDADAALADAATVRGLVEDLWGRLARVEGEG